MERVYHVGWDFIGGFPETSEEEEMLVNEARLQFQQALESLTALTKLHLDHVDLANHIFRSTEVSWTRLRWIHLLSYRACTAPVCD